MTKTLWFAFLMGLVFTVGGQAQTNSTAILLRDLLDLPAPPPVNRSSDTDDLKIERPDGFYATKNIPPDDAPIGELLDFWERQNGSFDEFRHNLKPSKETVRRLIAEIERDPQKLTNYLRLLPADPDVADIVKKLYEIEKQDSKLNRGWLEAVRRWLRNNSDMFVGELLAEVRGIKEENGRINNQSDLIALAKVDWEAAKPFVEAFERNAPQSGLYTLAKYILYHRAMDEENSRDSERYRGDLKKIVEDKTAGHKARDLAMDALVLGGDFDGRAEWYVTLLEDETLLELQENGYTGLTTLVRYSPNDRETWLPLMTKLLASSNRTLRSAAVRNLLLIDGLNKETALLLLPWLSNEEWAGESSDGERNRLIEFLGEHDVPESIPGLIRVLTIEENYMRGAAAKALVRYKSPLAIPALRAALVAETDSDYRASIIEALIAAGGMSDAEQLAGLEVYAAWQAKKKEPARDDGEEGEYYDEDFPDSVEMGIGIFLKDYESPRDSLVSLTFQRIRTLKKIDPQAAGVLQTIARNWKSRVVDLEALDLAGGGKGDVTTILRVLLRREEMRERIPNELALRRDRSSLLRGLCAVISDNTSDQAYILNSGDAESRIALLALARLVRTELAVRDVGALLNNPNKSLALAAERYLESEDSLEARKLILSMRKGEARILGAQHAFIPDRKKNFDAYRDLLHNLFEDVNGSEYWTLPLKTLNKTEDDLRAEFKTNGDLLAIYAFIADHVGEEKVLRVFKDKIVFTYYEDSARYWEKTVTPKEYEALYGFLLANRIDSLAPFTDCGRDCPNYEFVMFGRDGGRRIFYRNYTTPAPLQELEKIFDALNTGERRLHYWMADKLPGLEVLMSGDKFFAHTFWKNGSDFRILVEDKEKEKELIEDIEAIEKTEEAGEMSYSQRSEMQGLRRKQLAFKHYSWRKFENGKIGAEIAQPAEIAFMSENMPVVSWGGKYVYTPIPKTFNRRFENFEVRAENYYSGNLIKVFDSGAITVIKEGTYSGPIITPDGRWIVAAKRDESASKITTAVRIDVQTGKEFDVKIPPADAFQPIAFSDAHNRIVLYRARDEENSSDKDNPSPKTPEYYLLDAATGAFQLVKGEFEPLEHQTFRGLQPTGNPNEFWAALYDEKTESTRVGFYDARLFVFKPVLELPRIELDSMDIFVDKPASRLYFVYGGHLLALPLAGAQNLR